MWGWCWHSEESETGTRGLSWDLHLGVGLGGDGDGMGRWWCSWLPISMIFVWTSGYLWIWRLIFWMLRVDRGQGRVLGT